MASVTMLAAWEVNINQTFQATIVKIKQQEENISLQHPKSYEDIKIQFLPLPTTQV